MFGVLCFWGLARAFFFRFVFLAESVMETVNLNFRLSKFSTDARFRLRMTDFLFSVKEKYDFFERSRALKAPNVCEMCAQCVPSTCTMCAFCTYSYIISVYLAGLSLTTLQAFYSKKISLKSLKLIYVIYIIVLV